MGSSSERNWEALKRVPVDSTISNYTGLDLHRVIDIPVDGLSPNWTICLKLTPVAGKLE